MERKNDSERTELLENKMTDTIEKLRRERDELQRNLDASAVQRSTPQPQSSAVPSAAPTNTSQYRQEALPVERMKYVVLVAYML